MDAEMESSNLCKYPEGDFKLTLALGGVLTKVFSVVFDLTAFSPLGGPTTQRYHTSDVTVVMF